MTPIPPEKMAIYRQTARHRQQEAAQQLQERFQRAWDAARRAASLLKAQYGAEQVVVFGSLNYPELFHTNSDIDLAGWGTAEMAYYRIIGALMAVDPEFVIDFVRMEEAPGHLRAIIEAEGVQV